MQLQSKTRGQVSWSGNPLDEPVGPFESSGLVSTSVRDNGKAPARDDSRNDSGFMPYADSDLPDDVDFFKLAERAMRLATPPAAPRRHQQEARHAGSGHVSRVDPQTLRSAWANWFATHPVPHGHARAAASLRVKEPELLRALEGHGVHILRNDLAALLAPAAQWGRILVEGHHPLGFAYLGLSPRQVRHDGGQVVLLEADRQLLLAGHAFAECFLVYGAGACGIHGFDDHGEVVARLHLTNNSACAISHSIAMQHLLAYASGPGQGSSPNSQVIGSRLTRPGWCTIERQVHAPEALAEMCRLINLTLDDAPAMQFAMESEAVILACQATPLHKASAHAAVPQSLRDCKVHLRGAAVRHATVCNGSDGKPFVRLHAMDGNCLRFQHGGSRADAQAWVDSLLPRPT